MDVSLSRYLRPLTFRYTRLPPGSDHDHCAFCQAKFADAVSQDADLTAGYVTDDDGSTWICVPCFHDFRAAFAWTVSTPRGGPL